jgi:uncharacterized protein DUF6348
MMAELSDLAVRLIAESLTAVHGTWTVRGVDRLEGPGTTAVIVRRLDGEKDGPYEFGFQVNRDDPDVPVLWDYAVGFGATEEERVRASIHIWAQTTALVLLELITQQGQFASHFGPSDPAGFAGWHAIAGPILGWGADNSQVESLQRWVSENSLLPPLRTALLPALDRPTLNGVKMFFGSTGDGVTTEVRVNGQIAPEATVALGALDWPRFQSFGVVRTFVLLVHPDPVPDQAPGVEEARAERGGVGPLLAALVTLAGERPELGDRDLARALVARGFETKAAERMVVFAPVAFGRYLLRDMGIDFDPTFEVRGERFQTTSPLLLDQMAEYVAAVRAAPIVASSSLGFRALALRSAEVNAINNALIKGSQPADLRLTPTLITWDILDGDPPANGPGSHNPSLFERFWRRGR